MVESRSSPGIAAAAVLPWIVAALSILVALASWVGRERPSEGAKTSTSDPAEVKTLRLALATSTAENQALRSELDRLIGKSGAAAAAPAAKPAGPAGAATPSATPSEQVTELSGKIRESLSRAAVGDQDSAKDGAMALMQALQAGPNGFAAIRDAYLSTGDPKAKMMMLPTMIFGGGETAREFVLQQVQTESDPELHRALVTQAANFATPQYAESLKDTFLQALGGDNDATTRVAGIRGLRYAKGKEVQEALLAAVADPSEEIRMAAIENLASRPTLRDRLREAIGRDPSPHVQEIGNCRLLLAESGA